MVLDSSLVLVFFFFKQKTAYEIVPCDWSSDVCSSDLAALGTEMEDVLLPVRLVRDARVVGEATDDLHLIRLEPRLHPEGAPRPPLAGEAVADRDRERVPRDLQTKLSAVAGRFPCR